MSAALTIAEAARLAGISERVLRKRVMRKTVASIRVISNHKDVAGIDFDELKRHYPSASKPELEGGERRSPEEALAATSAAPVDPPSRNTWHREMDFERRERAFTRMQEGLERARRLATQRGDFELATVCNDALEDQP